MKSPRPPREQQTRKRRVCVTAVYQVFSRSRTQNGLAAGLLLVAGLCACAPGRAQEPARDAQRAYRAEHYAEAAQKYTEARAGAEPSQAAHYAYNEGIARWKAGDITNALATVRLAATDRDFTARAATLEGSLLLKQAEGEEEPAKRLALRDEALDAFARALQADPSDAARRNLARARNGFDRLRRDARRAAALKRYEGQHLGQLAPALLNRQRALIKAVPEVFGGPNPNVRLTQAGQLAKDVREQADRWFPVLEALPQAVTNETLRTELLTRATAAQNALDAAAERYEDLDADPRPLVDGEPFIYDLWKTVADPPALNTEAIAVQTNALTSVTRYQPARDDEEEALALVQQFRVLFPQWAEEQLKQQAASTNEVTFTEADRDLIARTADATVPLLRSPVVPDNKRKVMDNLLLIREHLPKQPNQNSPQNQQPPPPKEQQQKEQQEQQQEQKEQQEQKPQPSETKQQQAEDEDLQALLQKAADREREHEEAKRRAAAKAFSPDARDW